MRRLLVLALVAWLVDVPVAAAWTWPVDGPVLRPFVFGDDPYAAGQHRGIDIGGPDAGTIVAPAAGSVSFAGAVPHGGRTLTIETPDGYSVTLVHVGTLGAARGDPVSEGQAVGTLRPSGDVEWPQPYVHLGIRVTSDPQGYVDPLLLLPQRDVGASVVDEAPRPPEAGTVADTPPPVPEAEVPDPSDPDAEVTPPALVVETPVAEAVPGGAAPPTPADGGATVAVPAAEPAATGDPVRPSRTTETAKPPGQTTSAPTFAPAPAPREAPAPAPVVVPPAVGADAGPAAPARDAPPTSADAAPSAPASEAPAPTANDVTPTSGDEGEPVSAPGATAAGDAPNEPGGAAAPPAVSAAVAGPAFASTVESGGRRLPATWSVPSSQPADRAATNARRPGGTSHGLPARRAATTGAPLAALPPARARSSSALGNSRVGDPVAHRPARGAGGAGHRLAVSGRAAAVPSRAFAGGALLVLVATTLAGLAFRRRDIPARVPRAAVAGPPCRYRAGCRPVRPCRTATTADVFFSRLLSGAPARPGPSRPLAGRSGRAIVAARRRRTATSHAL